MNEASSFGSKIVHPARGGTVGAADKATLGWRVPIQLPQAWAPAWFYSALNWLGKTYYDANDVQQGFTIFMAGSDVDSYTAIGSTRLFLVVRQREAFELSIAANADAFARAADTTAYPATDDGIRDMYLALAASPVFDAVKFCYVPGRVGPDLDPTVGDSQGLENGYDPATGMRAVVLGTAVSQVVPLDDFIQTHNEQIYDESLGADRDGAGPVRVLWGLQRPTGGGRPTRNEEICLVFARNIVSYLNASQQALIPQ